MALDIVQLIKVTLGVLHTFVRFLPLGFYFFTYLLVYYIKTVGQLFYLED